MRRVRITKDAQRRVIDDGANSGVSCWSYDQCCNAACAAFAEVMMVKPDRTQDLVAICAAIPQQIPIGVLEEGKVAMPNGPVPTIVRG